MTVEITQTLAEDNLDDVYLKRGREYFKNGHVEKLNFDAQNQTITAEVIGSKPKPYQGSISFDAYDIDGDCSCPVQFNCKHVAAALYAVMA
ncbi:MAG: SWIM zinc finger family protein, partial [Ghiorsea sp.]|nr:SWIM zinc finger family protein [Ghiorsea sp.]